MRNSDDAYGWDCTIGGLQAKGGRYAVKMELSFDGRNQQGLPSDHYPFWILNDNFCKVGRIIAKDSDWIGESRLGLVSMTDCIRIAKEIRNNAEAITEQNFQAAQSVMKDGDV